MSWSENEQSQSSSPIPWKEMFESAASSPLVPLVPPKLTAIRSSPPTVYLSESLGANPRVRREASKPPLPSKGEKGVSQVTAEKVSSLPPTFASMMAETASDNVHSVDDEPSVKIKGQASGLMQLVDTSNESSDSSQQNFQLAVYIAMAHGVLMLVVIVLYGSWKLLECYRRPIQWAVLCSMPLRAIHGTIVAFWEKHLKQGLLGTVLAIPFAFCRALIVTALDGRLFVLHLCGQRRSQKRRTVKFTTLMEWLFSFAVMTLAFESMGGIALAVVPFIAITLYSFGVFLTLVPEIEDLETESERPLFSSEPSRRWEQARSWLGWVFLPITKTYKLLGARLTSALLNNLHHLVAILLIVLMIVGSLSGMVLFSYKIAHEGKGVVVALKTHVERGNYVEKVGLKQWIEDNNVPELIDTYAGKAYETVSSQIDVWAEKYQMTELADVSKQYLIGLAQGQRRKMQANSSETSISLMLSHPAFDRMQSIMQRCREYDVKGAYSELQQGAFLVLEHFNIPREELLDRAKQAAERWLGVGKHVFANSSKLVFAIARLLITSTTTILSGAPELINFCINAFVFFSVLHYLVVSKSGGVMEQVLDMIPLSESTRTRCAVVLDHAVSSVLLATVKAAFFQAMFTWLFFRVLKIHFLYMCTLLAFLSALLPIIPSWWSSIPAGAQLAIEGRYISAILLIAAHIVLMDYGIAAIRSGIPGHNAHLIGLSIAGGMALFSSAIEGAIMGPLLMTVAISLKTLYSEFILTTVKGDTRKPNALFA